jgi:hypothetical protein
MRVLDRAFGAAEHASGGYWVRKLGADEGVKAAQWLDAYILAWLAAEIAFFVVSPKTLPLLFAIPALYRLLEVVQVFVNAVLFDARRFGRKYPGARPYKVQSGERTLVQYVVLFLEIPLLFGVFYFVQRGHFANICSAADALAFSVGTVATLGDPSGATHAAIGGWRFLPLFEVLTGFLVGVIVLGRVLAVLPPVSTAGSPKPTSL